MFSLPYIECSYKDQSQGPDKVLGFRIYTSRSTKILRNAVCRCTPFIVTDSTPRGKTGFTWTGRKAFERRPDVFTNFDFTIALWMKSNIGERLDYLLPMFADAL